MFPALGLTLALLAPGAPIPKDVTPGGPAPYILNLKSEDDGKIRFTVLRTEKVKVTQIQIQNGPNGQQIPVQTESEVTVSKYSRVELAELKDLKVYSTDGKEVDVKEAAKKLADTAMAIASSNGKVVDSAFLKLFKDDVLVLVSPDLTPNGLRAPDWGRPGVIMNPGLPMAVPAIPIGPGVAPPLPPPPPLPGGVDLPPPIKPAPIPVQVDPPVIKPVEKKD